MKTKKIFILLLPIFLCLNGPTHASFELKGNGARSVGMGLAFVASANSAEAVFLNCSGTAQLNSPEFLFNYVRPFGMKELAHFVFAGVLPTSWGNIGAGISTFGNQVYQEQLALLNYSQVFKDKFFFGFNIQFMKLQIDGYGSDFCYGIDFGLLAKLNSHLNWGFFTTNINRPKLSSANDLLPQTFCTGISIFAVDNLTLNVDLYKELPFPLELRTGVEYILFNKIALRCGIISEPSQFCFGLGFLSNIFNCDYAVSTHPDLGLTHQFSLQLRYPLKN